MFLRDARRFVLYFGTIIQQVPLQVYQTTHVFSPTNSVVRTAFAQAGLSDWTKISEDTEKNWSSNLRTLEPRARRHFTCVAFSEDGKLASVTANGSIHVWNATSGDEIYTVDGLRANVSAMAFGEKGQLVIALWHAHQLTCDIRLYDTNDVSDWRTLDLLDRVRIDYLAFSEGDQRLSAMSKIGHAYMYDLASDHCVRKHNFSFEMKRPAALSPKGTWIAFPTGYTTTLVRWEGSSELQSRQFGDQDFNQAHVLAFSTDESLLSVGHRHSISIWDTKSGVCIHRLRPDDTKITVGALALTRNHLASSFWGGALSFWDLKTAHETHFRDAHAHSAQSLAFSPSGEMVASGSLDSSIKTWDPRMSSTRARELTPRWVENLWSFGSHSEYLATQLGKTATVWSIKTGASVRSFSPCDALAAVEAKPLLACASDESVEIWDTDQWTATTFKLGQKRAHFLRFSHDGTRLVSIAVGKENQAPHDGAIDGNGDSERPEGSYVQVWDVKTGACEVSLYRRMRNLKCAAIFTKGTKRLLAVVEPMGAVELHSANENTFRVMANFDGSKPLTFLNNGAHLLGVNWAGIAMAIETTKGDIVWQHKMPSPVSGLVFQSAIYQFLQLFQQNPVQTTRQLHISIDGRWIMSGEERLLWLPFQYLATCASIHGSTVAFSSTAGTLSILRCEKYAG